MFLFCLPWQPVMLTLACEWLLIRIFYEILFQMIYIYNSSMYCKCVSEKNAIDVLLSCSFQEWSGLFSYDCMYNTHNV